MRYPETAGPASTEKEGVNAEMARTGMITRIWHEATVPNVQPSTENLQDARIVPLNSVWPRLFEEIPPGKKIDAASRGAIRKIAHKGGRVIKHNA